nr:MAG TPA: hypothetical protein [Caudoviricetes sp.]
MRNCKIVIDKSKIMLYNKNTLLRVCEGASPMTAQQPANR